MNDKSKGIALGCLLSLCITIIVPIIFFIVVAVMAYNDASTSIEKKINRAVHGNNTAELGGVDEFPVFDEIWSTGVEGGEKFVRITINGTIDLSARKDQLLSDEEGTPAFALDCIKSATCDEGVRGIILEIDSPGGGVTDSDIIYNALCKFKEAATNRVVFVLSGDLCASGGYYISAAADYIMAHPTSVLGSIGVIMPGVNVKQLADRVGVKEEYVSSGVNKTMGLLGDMTEGERAIRQAIVDDMYTRFVGLVADGRNMPVEKVREIADGSIYTANKCLELGLVDGIGYYDDLVDVILERTGCDSLYVVRYLAPIDFSCFKGFGKIFGQALGQSVIESLTKTQPARSQYLYDWR